MADSSHSLWTLSVIFGRPQNNLYLIYRRLFFWYLSLHCCLMCENVESLSHSGRGCLGRPKLGCSTCHKWLVGCNWSSLSSELWAFFCDWHLAVLCLIHFCCFTVWCLLFYLLYFSRCLFPCIVLLFGACYCYVLYFSRRLFPCIVLMFSLLMKVCFFPKEQLIYIFHFSLNDRI